MSRQGFVTINTDPYVYIENTANNTVSMSMGIDSSGTGLFNINLSTSAGAAPGAGFQPMAVDPVTGVITFTPLGGGYVLVDGPLQTTGGVSYAGDILTLNDAASAAANSVIMEKDRSGGVITTGDALGQVYFKGYDGTAYVTGASITSTSSGTIAANRVASNLVFSTHPDSASGLTPTTRMTIASTGAVTIAAPDSGVGLTISGGGLTVTGTTTLNTALAVASGGTGAGTHTAHGVLIGAAASAIAATSAGTAGQPLLSGGAGADPDWGTLGIAYGGTNATTFATTDGTVYYDGTRLVATATGTSGQVLTSGGAGVAPAYASLPANVSSLTGTADQVTASAATGAVTLSVPSTFTSPGSVTATTSITATLGDVTLTNGDVVVSTATKGITLPGGLRVITGAKATVSGITAPVGSLFLATDGSGVNDRAYINTNGGTTWTAIVTVA